MFECFCISPLASEATSLGAKTACQQAFEYSKRPNVISEVVTDLQALESVELFLGKFITVIKAIKQLNNNKACFAVDHCVYCIQMRSVCWWSWPAERHWLQCTAVSSRGYRKRDAFLNRSTRW